ncbi:ataxin-1-like [Coregonus clupeaformis]|uniref:ataxin-1-like n=1 Tax=Coregonus clupeaformis TaxID=59861 RepID=UPI001E1C74A2|nr:ataxin-1-like [Coregonus clupeaformis]XP_045072001.1 ataxin-1-like [Coregonus clupeaformis]
MKSNHERSNECLPPKKRDFPASTADERPLVMAPASETQRGENLAWLASVAGGHNRDSSGGNRDGGRAGQRTSTPSESDVTQYKPLYSTGTTHLDFLVPSSICSISSSSSSHQSSVVTTSLPAMYTSPLSQSGGGIHYTQLPPNLQFISSPYTGPYAGYISSQLPPPPTSTSQCSYPNTATKLDQHHSVGPGRPPPQSQSLPPGLAVSDTGPQYIQLSGSSQSVDPRTAPSPHGGTHHMHPDPHHTLAFSGSSQVLVQYACPGSEGPLTKREEGQPRELHNGELEKRSRFERKESKGTPSSSSSSSSSSSHHQLHQQQSSQHHYETYTSHDASGLRTSLMPNSHGGQDHQSPNKLPPSSASHPEKSSLLLGKPVYRTSSSTSSTFTFPPQLNVESLKAAVSSPHTHTVIQTTHNASDASPPSLGQLSTNFYQAGHGGQPIISYLSGGAGGQQYHTSLPQHLLIPGAPGSQPIIIPVSGAGVTSLEATHAAHIATTTQPQPHAYATTTTNPNPKEEHLFEVPAPYPPLSHPAGAGGSVVQAQLHLPVVPPLPAPSSAPSGPSLPPYFIKGSIIQLADGELKRVEDLKTDDFIQSAEISSELKIDSSTVERIDGSHTPNLAIVQFSVGEHRAQVSVEVLVEYPFFVFGQGWSSCCPDRTTQLLELPCTKLSVGDVCISLTLKNLRNGSLKKTQQTQNQAMEITTSCNMGSIHGPLKPSRCSRGGRGSGRHGEQENGVGHRGSSGSGGVVVGGVQIASENGELRFGVGGEANLKRGQPGDSESSRGAAKPASRKRRWSAPEGRKVERSEEEPPLTLPKPSFITQEVKISIEGRSNIGK